ncbi:MAG: hypothetical protein ABSE15_00465 [Candidatus Bathyarchaeia archaeon]|jgi:hypothetical protein
MYNSKKGNKSYANRRRMSVNPSAFTAGFEGAVKKAEELAAQGWLIDTDQGALDPEQAAKAQKEAQKQGYDTEVIPIVKEGDDVLAQFVAVKPKSAAPMQQTPQPASAGPPVTTNTLLDPQEAEAAFVKSFYKGKKPTANQMDNGFVMMPGRVGAFIRRDATPQGQTAQELVKMAEQGFQDNPWGTVTGEALNALSYAQKDKKTGLVLGAAGSEIKVPLDKFVQGVNALGGAGRVKMAGQKKDGLAFLQNTEGDRILIAPLVGDPLPSDVSYNDALAKYRSNP